MLSAFVVAVGLVEPAILERVPVTPAVLVGRWEMVSTFPRPLPGNAITFVFRADGTFTFEPRNLVTGEVGAKQGGTYKSDGRVVTIDNLTPGYKAHVENDAVLLPRRQLRLTNREDRAGVICVKVSDKP